MSNFTLSKKSLEKLSGVDSNLVCVVKKAITKSNIDFCVTEGLRTLERQQELFNCGKSKTLNSLHLTGHAVDLGAIVNGTISWEWKYYEDIAMAMKAAAIELSVPIEWGGDWKTFKDGCHFQIKKDNMHEEII